MSENKTYEIRDGKVCIRIPAKNNGKFRWKNKENVNEYGKGFSTDNIPYSENSYVEWQIGYDVPVKEYNKKPEKKPTTLNSPEWIFQSMKDVDKYPYELPEFLCAMAEAGLVCQKDVDNLIKDIESITDFFESKFQITTSEIKEYAIGGLCFHQQDITLPRFVYYEKEDYPYVEISIQKQQYATGIQAMLYFCIPITALKDRKKMIGKTAKQFGQSSTWLVIDESNKECILNLFRFFGVCSETHNHDITEILKLIDDYLSQDGK